MNNRDQGAEDMTPDQDILKVTRLDVEHAILIAEILGGYHEAFPQGDDNVDLCCLVNFVPRDAHHCATCTCKSDKCAQCEHRNGSYECVVGALGASSEAQELYLLTYVAIVDLADGISYDDPEEDAGTLWVASLLNGTALDRETLQPDLEAAALLRDGLLPPRVALTQQHVAAPEGQS